MRGLSETNLDSFLVSIIEPISINNDMAAIETTSAKILRLEYSQSR
mgnify:CR=1 FL=1